MGLIFRKTIRLGPLRLNFTKHGFSSWSIRIGQMVVELASPQAPRRPPRPRVVDKRVAEWSAHRAGPHGYRARGR